MADPLPPQVKPAPPRVSGFWAKLSLTVMWLPFPALLLVGGYARAEPSLFGFPFFYWYQFAWIFVSVALTGCAYLHTTPIRPAGAAARRTTDRGERLR
ncbi:DUF3311 domain-containing protein [Nonomuraea sp. NPDC048916]|uniref:DUF3311 domain-containing protein n=1 Tax=Nonomuraea sp. NPDC048916 TaxID=3154232 RepID=UPI0034021A4A